MKPMTITLIGTLVVILGSLIAAYGTWKEKQKSSESSKVLQTQNAELKEQISLLQNESSKISSSIVGAKSKPLITYDQRYDAVNKIGYLTIGNWRGEDAVQDMRGSYSYVNLNGIQISVPFGPISIPARNGLLDSSFSFEISKEEGQFIVANYYTLTGFYQMRIYVRFVDGLFRQAYRQKSIINNLEEYTCHIDPGFPMDVIEEVKQWKQDKK